ncbi:MAG: hypothetical protein ACI9EF_003721 [Pseudohongiellaceae bacterium]|jgi:hypothetical protein
MTMSIAISNEPHGGAMAAALMGLVTTLALLLGATEASAQDTEIQVPAELSSFWAKWTDAKKSPQDAPMDKVVRQGGDDAEILLNLLLEDVSKEDSSSLFHELRLLAWSMDRVQRTERYISRVRLVNDMDLGNRKRRVAALGQWYSALEAEEAARKLRTDRSWADALAAYDKSAKSFESFADWEYVVFCLVRCGEIENRRDRKWEQARFLKQVIEVAAKLPFDDPAAKLSEEVLATLAASGIDPEKDRPEDTPSGGTGDARGGVGLEAYAAGSAEEVFSFARMSSKKGIAGVELPSYFSSEQYQLWPVTWVAKQGPSDFDSQRGAFFKPEGSPWQLSRDGMETFLIDSDGDGEPEVTFAASSTPAWIEVPATDGGDPYAFMVASISRQEAAFNVVTNYAPDVAGARLRFFPAYWYEGKILGEKWRIFDIDMDGGLGKEYAWSDDLYTDLDLDLDAWWSTDALQIGRSKKAIPWSSVLPLGEDFYRASIDLGKNEVKLRKMNITTGEVLLDMDTKVMAQTVVVRAVDEHLRGAFFEITPTRKGKGVRLPVGKYQLANGRIAKGNKTSMDQVRMYAGDSAPFEVREGETTTLELGAPYKLVFKTKSHADGIEVDGRSLRIYGRSGEEYAMLFDDPLQPLLEVQDRAGRKVGKPFSMRQAAVSDWQVDTVGNVLWFPLNEVIAVPRGETYQMRMTQKAHSLLGGPLQSDWIR